MKDCGAWHESAAQIAYLLQSYATLVRIAADSGFIRAVTREMVLIRPIVRKKQEGESQ